MSDKQAILGHPRGKLPFAPEGDRVEAGQRIGMIRFGSCVNCEIPAGYELDVKVGDAVTAGKTVIAKKVDA